MAYQSHADELLQHKPIGSNVMRSDFKRRLLFSPLSVAGVVLGLCWALRFETSPYIFNITGSLPVGLYRRVPFEKEHRGEVVSFHLPKRLLAGLEDRPWLRPEIPLMKRVAALEGDLVCVTNERVSVNGVDHGPLSVADDSGLAFPRVINGCRKLGRGEILPLGDSAKSFDGRYFGTIAASEVESSAIPLFTWN